MLEDRSLPDYLRRLGLLPADGAAHVEPAGDGNINFVRRVRRPDGSSLVIKHARARLERFPEYAAPVARLHFEHRYGEIARERVGALADVLPSVLHFDPEAPLLAMEDLGRAPRLDDALLAGARPAEPLRRLGRFLGAVHRATAPDAPALAERFSNREMQELHGEHIFTLPFEDNAFPIEPSLREQAARQLARPGLRKRIEELRALYYDSRAALVHADVQAGNILLAGDRPKLLDAEIAHVGDPAFDLGTALAHLRFHAVLADDPNAVAGLESALLDGYRDGGGRQQEIERAPGYAAVEMLRRTIGAARLPFLLEPGPAERVLAHAFQLLAG